MGHIHTQISATRSCKTSVRDPLAQPSCDPLPLPFNKSYKKMLVGAKKNDD